MREAGKRLEPVCEQLGAYLGWLLTNPSFLVERDALQAKWQAAVEQIGAIPHAEFFGARRTRSTE